MTAEQTIKDRGVEALEIAARWPDADRATLVTLAAILAATGADAEGLSYFETLAAEQPDQVLPLVLAGNRLIERHQVQDPFRFLVYAEMAGAELGPAR